MKISILANLMENVILHFQACIEFEFQDVQSKAKQILNGEDEERRSRGTAYRLSVKTRTITLSTISTHFTLLDRK